MKLTHGGDIYTPVFEGKGPVVDFSANVNPMGVPEGVIEAVKNGLSQCDRYPDPLNRELKKAISDSEKVSEDLIVCGNGAADLIFRLVRWVKPKKALITAPTFSEYEEALLEEGCLVVRHRLKEERSFDVTEDFLLELDSKLDMVFLCSPNNPTGRTISKDLLVTILERCEEMDIILVLDECFNSFLDKPDEHSLKDRLSSSKSLFILKAFTKTYAMAGFRLGYGLCSCRELAEGIEEKGQPWSVSTPAQLAGIQALKEEEYLRQARQLVKQERSVLFDGLTELGIEMISGEANYLFFKVGSRSPMFSSKTLKNQLLEMGFLIRSCANYSGLSGEYFRIAVRTPEENRKFLEAMKEISCLKVQE